MYACSFYGSLLHTRHSSPASSSLSLSLSLYTHTHPTMDKIWMKEKIHKCFLLIQAKPFLVLILLIVVMSTILCAITPCLLVLCTVTCVALGTGEFLRFASRTGELQFCFSKRKVGSASSHMDVCRNCDHVFNTQVSPCVSWKYQFAQSLLQISRSALACAKTHALSELEEECLYAGIGVGYNKQGTVMEHTCTHKDRLIQLGAVNELMTGLDNADLCENGELIVCKDGLIGMVAAADGKVQTSCDISTSTCEHEVGDVPELEDCGTSSEEEEVCKSVFETTAHASGALNDIAPVDATLQPVNDSEAAQMCVSEDEHAIDKHQILPVEGVCKQCKSANSKDMDAGEFSSCRTYGDVSKLKVTDAELQNAASEYYTLEGDVLWNVADLKKQSSSRRGIPLLSKTCEFCKQEGMLSISSKTCKSIFSSKAWSGAKTFARVPACSKVVYYVDPKRSQDESGSEDSVCASAEELNDDVMLDKELRAIASRCGNKGEESNYMSTAGSFRDYMGSFREMDTFWPEYDITGKKEDEYYTGCCDDHAKPCISHSRSRSKVLQTDPLLSKASLIREQEMMDVLWQEYNEDRRQKHNNLAIQQRDIAHKQKSKAGIDGSGSISEVLNEGSTYESFNVDQSDYVMKLNTTIAGHGSCERHDASAGSCRYTCDKPCWAKARSYQRRRHFVGFCRLFRELGLKQCMQSSKVDN